MRFQECKTQQKGGYKRKYNRKNSTGRMMQKALIPAVSGILLWRSIAWLSSEEEPLEHPLKTSSKRANPKECFDKHSGWVLLLMTSNCISVICYNMLLGKIKTFRLDSIQNLSIHSKNLFIILFLYSGGILNYVTQAAWQRKSMFGQFPPSLPATSSIIMSNKETCAGFGPESNEFCYHPLIIFPFIW